MTHKIIATAVFGERGRYKVSLDIDRFGTPCVFVDDAEQPDESTGLATTIVQLSCKPTINEQA
jgi:tRNA G26 N,N-dimethylase Trm1